MGFQPHPRFGAFSKQLRHVVCVSGVYNDAMLTKRADFSKKNEHYGGGHSRDELLAALEDKQRDFDRIVNAVDTAASIDFSGHAFTFGTFTREVIQHEAIHHGQWSVYAALAGFQTPRSWQQSWKL